MSIVHDPEVAVHVDHCCVIHGCKYGDDRPGGDGCPVVSSLAFQERLCDSCSSPDQLRRKVAALELEIFQTEQLIGDIAEANQVS